MALEYNPPLAEGLDADSPNKADIRGWFAQIKAEAVAQEAARAAADIMHTEMIETQAQARRDGIANTGLLLLTNIAGVDTITASLDPVMGPGITITAGSTVELVPSAANTGPVTLQIGAFGPWPVRRRAGADLAAGDLKAGAHYILRRHGNQWRIIGLADSDVAAQVGAEAALREALLRSLVADIGVVTLSNIAQPTPNTITADIPARLVDLGITKLTGAAVIVVRPVADTTGEVELVLTGGTTVETVALTDWGGQKLNDKNYLRAGRFYQFERWGPHFRLHAGGVYYSDLQATEDRLLADIASNGLINCTATGTATAITATSRRAVQAAVGQSIVLRWPETSTGEAIALDLNGQGPLALLTSGGHIPAAGALLKDATAIVRKFGDQWRVQFETVSPKALADLATYFDNEMLTRRNVVAHTGTSFASTTFRSGVDTVLQRAPGGASIWMRLDAAPDPQTSDHQQDKSGNWWQRVLSSAALDNRRVFTHTGTSFVSTTFPDAVETVVQRSAADTSIWMRLTEAPADATAGVYQQDKGGVWWERTLALSSLARDIATHGLIDVTLGGTANAVIATPRTPVVAAQGQMLLVRWTATNTGAMTLTYGSETERPLLTIKGAQIAAGGAQKDGIALVRRYGDHWRLWVDLSLLDRIPGLETAFATLSSSVEARIKALSARIDMLPTTGGGTGDADAERARALAAEAGLGSRIDGETRDRQAAVETLSARQASLEAASVAGIAGPYATTAAGEAATADGGYFLVADGASQRVSLYLRQSTSGLAAAAASTRVADWTPPVQSLPTTSTGDVQTSGDFSPDDWTTSDINPVYSQTPAMLLPHEQGARPGYLTLTPGVTAWARRPIRVAMGAGAKIRAVVEVSGTGGGTAQVEIVARVFGAFNAPASTITRPQLPLGDGTHVLTMVIPQGTLGANRLLRIGVKEMETTAGTATVRLTEVVSREFDGRWSIYDFNPDLTPGADNSPAFERALAAMPSGSATAINYLDLGGATWSVSRPVRTLRNYTGIQNGRLVALGTAADWTTAENADQPDIRNLHRLCGWPDDSTRQMALLRLHGYRIGARNLTLTCNWICGGWDDVSGDSLRLENINIDYFGVYAGTYINGSGFNVVKGFAKKWDWGDPRRGKASLQTGIGLYTTRNDGIIGGWGGIGGQCGWYQAAGGSMAVGDFHWWQSVEPEFVVTGPKKAGDTVRSTAWMVDDVVDLKYPADLLSVTLDAEGYPTYTFAKDWAGPSMVLTCAPRNPYNAILKGWGSSWLGSYLDNGKFQLWGTGHVFRSCYGLMLTSIVNTDCLFELVPTAAGQSLNNLVLDVRLNDGVATWAKAIPNPQNPAASWKGQTAFLWRKGVRFVGSTPDTLLGDGDVVQTVLSTAAKSMTEHVAADGKRVRHGSDAGNFAVDVDGRRAFGASAAGPIIPVVADTGLPATAPDGSLCVTATGRLMLRIGGTWRGVTLMA